MSSRAPSATTRKPPLQLQKARTPPQSLTLPLAQRLQATDACNILCVRFRCRRASLDLMTASDEVGRECACARVAGQLVADRQQQGAAAAATAPTADEGRQGAAADAADSALEMGLYEVGFLQLHLGVVCVLTVVFSRWLPTSAHRMALCCSSAETITPPNGKVRACSSCSKPVRMAAHQQG
jgi:hypothetical protein